MVGLFPAMASLYVKPRSRLFHGHCWVYQSDVSHVVGDAQPGDVIMLKDRNARPVGSAIYNPKSQIVARRFSHQKFDLDHEFFVRRLKRALSLRESLFAQPLYRLVWSESDGLPGLIVDRYGDHCVVQTLTLAMDQRKAAIASALTEVIAPKSIIERNDAPIRQAEGLGLVTGVLAGEAPAPFQVTTPHGVFTVDLRGGQKTGLYLDQLDNYAAVAALAKGKRVLDVFCNQGGFALACAKAGAASVTGVDASENAVAAAKSNAEATGVTAICQFEATNAFDFLKAAEQAATAQPEAPAPYDLIVLDPPSFTRNKGSLKDAMRGYKEIHLRSLKLLRPGGLLSTYSCSHHVSRDDFSEMIIDAATDAKRTLRLVSFHSQRRDHPILAGIPETEYLKGFTWEVIGAW